MVLVRGIELEVHQTVEDISNVIRKYSEFYESEILDYIQANYPNQGTIVDVGANIGNHTVYFANFLEYEGIIAFEPIPENFTILKNNTEKYHDIVCVEAAASDFNGEIAMARNFNNMGAGTVLKSADEFEGAIAVPCFKIDSYFLHNVTLMKIDAEGHEPWILRGAAETIAHWNPLILIEDHNDEYKYLIPEHYELIAYWNKYRTYLYG